LNRFFNTAGPVKPDIHYQLDALTRLDWDEIQLLIRQQSYFVLHAPRQTGKTSTMLAMMAALNDANDYIALYANIEGAQAARNDLEAGISAICSSIADHALVHLNTDALHLWLQNQGQHIPVAEKLRQLLSFWSRNSQKPCVLFIDEVDALVGDTLVSLLRQIRAGFAMRPAAFPQSIVLCGVRDVRDYRIHSAGEIITGGSAFNIKSESLRMGNFSETDVKALYLKHTQATGQHFDDDIFATLWQDTQGQPWLVNALAYQVCWKAKENRDRSKTITLEDYQSAREQLIYARTTHLDQLSDKLKEPRVHSVIAPMLATDYIPGHTTASLDDLQYVEDLGLIQLKPQLRISNRIYQEIIPRELSYPLSVVISHEQAWYLTDDNHLNMVKLLSAFQQFFRENIEAWCESFDYKEAGPQLIMQAFLQRIVNGGGRISREYALGRKRTDLLIEWPTTDKGFLGEVQRIVIELKILYGSLETDINKGLEQTANYADSVGATESHLVIFNRDDKISWEDKIWQRQEQHQTSQISVWGC
jgi:hypothetical protein